MTSDVNLSSAYDIVLILQKDLWSPDGFLTRGYFAKDRLQQGGSCMTVLRTSDSGSWKSPQAELLLLGFDLPI